MSGVLLPISSSRMSHDHTEQQKAAQIMLINWRVKPLQYWDLLNMPFNSVPTCSDKH